MSKDILAHGKPNPPPKQSWSTSHSCVILGKIGKKQHPKQLADRPFLMSATWQQDQISSWQPRKHGPLMGFNHSLFFSPLVTSAITKFTPIFSCEFHFSKATPVRVSNQKESCVELVFSMSCLPFIFVQAEWSFILGTHSTLFTLLSIADLLSIRYWRPHLLWNGMPTMRCCTWWTVPGLCAEPTWRA